jgi:hypothetical protein
VFQLISLVYLAVSLVNGKFQLETLLAVGAFSLVMGVIVSFIFAWSELSQLDNIKKLLSGIDLNKIRNSKLKLIDEYKNGWGRTVNVVGISQNRKIKINYRHEKVNNRRQLLLVFLVELERDFYEEAGAMPFGYTTKTEAITYGLNNAIIASKDPKFGEIYWELKRRRTKNRSHQ